MAKKRETRGPGEEAASSVASRLQALEADWETASPAAPSARPATREAALLRPIADSTGVSAAAVITSALPASAAGPRPETSRLAPVREPAPGVETPPPSSTRPAAPVPAVQAGPPPVAYLYGPPPRLDKELLGLLLHGGESILALFVPRAELLRFIAQPEPLEVFRERFQDRAKGLARLQDFAGDLTQMAHQITNRPDWSELRQATQHDQAYRAQIAQHGLELREKRLTRLRAEVERSFADRYLSLVEQQALDATAAGLGLTGGDAAKIIQQVFRELKADGLAPAPRIEEGLPLVRRDPSETVPPLVRLSDLVDLADKHLEAVLDDLVDAIEKDKLQQWLQARGLGNSAVWDASSRALRYLGEAGTSAAGRRKQLLRGAWDVLWSSGLAWLDLNWEDGARHRPRRVSSVADLTTALEKEGIGLLQRPATAGLLELWFKALEGCSEGTRDAARLAEKNQRPLDSWRLAWRCGVRTLAVADGRRVLDAEGLCALDPRDEALAKLVEPRLLACWVGDRLGRPDLQELLQKHKVPLLQVQAAQWLLGRRSLQCGSFQPAEPQTSQILAAALGSYEAFCEFGQTIRDGSLALWLGTVSGPLAGDVTERFVQLGQVDQPNELLAQFGCELLGQPQLVIFPNKEDTSDDVPTLLASVDQLAERAHEVWGGLTGSLLVVRCWVAGRCQGGKRLVELPGDLFDLLAAAGDTTLRCADGKPYGLNEGLRFGRAGHPPDKVRNELLGWLHASRVLPESLLGLYREGMLERWMRLQLPDTAPRLDAAAKELGGDLPRLLAALWALGYLLLPVRHGKTDVVFSDLADLVARAHEVWSELDAAEGRLLVRTWLARGKGGARPSAAADLFTQLAQAGDTTMRQPDGLPLGYALGQQRFGGLVPQAPDAEQTRRRFVEWITTQDAPPSCVQRAFEAGLLQRWAELHLPKLHRDLNDRVARLADPQGKFLSCLWAFGYTKLVLDAQCSVTTVAELVTVAGQRLAAIERLFDTQVLDAWVDAEARARLDRVRTRVQNSQTVLDTLRGLGSRETPRWLREREPLQANLLFRNPVAWLTVRDRAALALVALGGRLLLPQVAEAKVVASDLPPDQELEVAVPLAPAATPGDIPCHLLLLTEDDGRLRSAPLLSTATLLTARFSQQELLEFGRSFTSPLRLVSVTSEGEIGGRPFELQVGLHFPYARLAQALSHGLAFALIALAVVALVWWTARPHVVTTISLTLLGLAAGVALGLFRARLPALGAATCLAGLAVLAALLF